MLIVLFGPAGAGKTHVAKILQKHFGFLAYDGDIDLPPDMKHLLLSSKPITDDMRDTFFDRLIESVRKIYKKEKSLIVTQTFIKEKYRQLFLKNFPDTYFVLVQTRDDLRKKRLQKRKEFPLEDEYVRRMDALFEDPFIAHKTIINDSEDEEEIVKQFEQFKIIPK